MDSYYKVYYVIYIHTVVLNSTANGIIYVVRLRGVQLCIKFLFSSLTKCCFCFSKGDSVKSKVSQFASRKVGGEDRIFGIFAFVRKIDREI